MTPQEALQVLNVATEPANLVRLTRLDYWHVHEALIVLEKLIAPAPVGPLAPEQKTDP